MNHIETLLAHAALTVDADTAAVIPPIHLATTFERDSDNSYPHGYKYSREANPTRSILESALCLLEDGFDCRTFASGMAACNVIVQSLEPGAHLIIPVDVYHGFRRLVFEDHVNRGVLVSSVDMNDPDTIRNAVNEATQMIWVETPSNPLLQITDIKAVSEIAKQAGATLVVDGTWTTPVLQRPFEWGADLVMHSLTKYIAGHSDVLGGAVIAKESTGVFDRISRLQQRAGAVLDPFSCWLAMRGMRTLAVRLRAQCDNATAVATFLNDHPRIAKVHFPGLPGHPSHEVAARQMTRFGAMLSIEVAGREEDAIKLASHVKLFRRATSLGGTESLIEHRASAEGPNSPTPPELLRLSMGLENPEDLIGDLSQALNKI